MTRLRHVAIGACVVGILAASLVGCREREPMVVNSVEDVMEAPAPPEPPPEERAAQIIADVTRVGTANVTIVDQMAHGDVLTINATIPAHEKMLPHHAAAPDTGGGAETEQRIEWVKVRWNTAVDQPIAITWPERLQFAEQEPIGEKQALETARKLKQKWMPEVPAEMVLQPPRLLNRPVWAIAWRGETEDGVLTGDQVAVQVSSLTGLPIAYSQRAAIKRPAAEEIEVTREQAIEAAREALIRRVEEDVVEEISDVSLVARLVLSAPQHPEGGPAWLVRGTGERDALMVPVDAMSGDAVVADDAGARRSTPDGGDGD